MGSSHLGLLQKANLLSSKKGLAFSEFISKHNITTCSLFTKINGNFYITNSVGFDAVSICCSKSTDDFWTGSLPEKNTIYTYSTKDSALNSILQFFSLKFKDEINECSLYRTSEKILLVCNQQINENIISDFLMLDDKITRDIEINDYIKQLHASSIPQMFIINTAEAIEATISLRQKTDFNAYNHIKKAIYNEILNRLSILFSNPSLVCDSDNSSIKVVLVSDIEIPFELTVRHIITCLSEVLDNNSSLLDFDDCGKCQTLIQIKDFIQG